MFMGWCVLASHQWNPKAFILERRPEVPLKQGWDIGYDAQWYYAIAIDPIHAVHIVDQPAYRYQRMIYPLLVRLLSFGKVEWMPWVMLFLNLVASSLVSYQFAKLITRKGASPWICLVVMSSIGFLLAMRLDLLEPLALALALTGWVIFDEDLPWMSIFLFALAGLTKEIGLLFAGSMAVWLFWRKKGLTALYVFLGAFFPYLLWRAFLFYRLGDTVFQNQFMQLSWIPFSGFFTLKDLPSQLMIGLWVILPAVLGILLMVWQLWHQNPILQSPETYLVCAEILLVALLPRLTWIDPLAVLRTGSGLLVALVLWMAIYNRRLLPYLAALYIPSGLLLVLVPGFYFTHTLSIVP
jgi:hypothetical protein